MAVFRVEKNHNYTVMSNYHLRDTGLTLKAIGLGGAIVGKALYTGALDLARAISIAKED